MPVTEKKYPEWVQKHRVKGTTVKKKGDSYYLYKRTSRRVKGKKYPQPVDTYIGIITPEGGNTKQQKEGIFNRCRSMGIRVFKSCLGIVPG